MSQNFVEVDELARTSEDFFVPLRMMRGFDFEKFQLLCSALRELREIWKESDVVPKSAASILVDLYPTMDSVSYLYSDEEGRKIREHAEVIGDLVRECVKI